MIDNFGRFALFLALVAPLAADDWPMYLHDPAHSSFNQSESRLDKRTVTNLQPGWITSVGAPMAAAPTIVGGVMYIGAWDGNFYAIDARTGATLWSAFVGVAPNPESPNCTPGIGVTAQAAVVGNVVYVGGGDSKVYALDKRTGAELWHVPVADPA